jgi:hypothetical protein
MWPRCVPVSLPRADRFIPASGMTQAPGRRRLVKRQEYQHFALSIIFSKRSWKICVCIARFSSIKKKVSKIFRVMVGDLAV